MADYGVYGSTFEDAVAYCALLSTHPYSDRSGGGLAGLKRTADALYHQTGLGSHNTIGQSEALFSTSSVFKNPRIEPARNLPIFPQRPGVKDCAHYMLTRTCKFGDACIFHHPMWVPEGGIPNWKEIPQVHASESLPERPGAPDCPFYMKTQLCKFGPQCKFNHPKDKLNALAGGDGVNTGSTAEITLPECPLEPICMFYSKTGSCKFGASCKFHHPKDLRIPSSGQNTGTTGQTESAVMDNGVPGGDSVIARAFTPAAPALLHNSKGLPIRPGETDCPFYLKTESCKYGATCRYNHPDITSVYAAMNPLMLGLSNPTANLISNLSPLLGQSSLGLGVGSAMYPQRPGQTACDFYMKTGVCKFGEGCKFHHPIDRSASGPSLAHTQSNVKLTPAGLPRREGSDACAFYMKTGMCKFGVTCKFDHPPPAEAVTLVIGQESGTGATSAFRGDEVSATASSAAEEQH